MLLKSKVPMEALNIQEILHLSIKKGTFAPEQMLLEIQKFIIKELLAKQNNLMKKANPKTSALLKKIF